MMIPPPLVRTIPATAASPSPRPVNFVEKKGSKTFDAVSAVMPHPVSVTSSTT